MSNKQKHIKPCMTAKREQDNKAIKQAGNGTMTFMVWSIAGTSLVIYNNPIFGQDTDLAGSGFKYLLVGLGPLSKGVLFTDLNEDGQYDNGTDTFIGITDIDGTAMAISPPEIGQTTVAHLNNAYDFATGLVLNGTWRSLPYEGNEDVVISALTDLLANELDNAPEGAVADAGGMAAYLQPMLNDIFGTAPARDGSGDPTPMITLADVLNSENYDPLSNGVAGQLMSRAVIALTQSDAVDWASARTELQGLFSDYRTRIADTNDDNDSVILSGDLASDIEDALQDAADRPVEDVLPDVADRPVEDVSPDVADRPDENVSPDVTDDLVEDALPDVADRPVEDVSPDAADRPVEDVLQDEADRLVEDALLDASNRPIAFGPNGGGPVIPTGGGDFVPAIANPDPISPFDSLAPLGDNDNAEINEAPIEVISDGLSVAEGEASAITNALLEFTDVDNGAAELTYTITDAPDHGILQISSDGGSTWESLGSGRFTQVDIDANRVRYQHGGSENLADGFEYSVRDGANTVTGSFAITISPVNDAPTATESTSPAPDKAAVESGHDDVGGVIPGDDMASGSFIHSDPDAGQGDFTGGIPEVAFVGAATTDYTPIEDGAISTPVRGMYGTLTLMSGTWRYEIDNSATDMLAEGETVMDSFLIRIRDTADAVSNAIPIDIMITGTNDRPVITTTDSTTGTRIISDTNRDSINTFASLTGMAQAQDPDADDSAFTWAGDLQDISPTGFGTLSFDPGNTGMWTFDPDAAAINALSQGEQSVLIYDITATDAQGAISQAMPLMITITGINDAPTQVISDGLSVTEGGEREITTALLQFNDVDNDAEDLTYTITDAPDYGKLQKLVGGTWGDLGTNTFTQADIDAGRVRYQHGGSENLADSFEYSVRDGAEGDLNTNTVMGSFDITISQGNDAPTVTETTSPAPDKEAVESGHDDVGGIILGDTIASGAFTHSDPDMAQSGFVAGTPEAARAGTTDYTSTPVRGMYGTLALTSGTWRYEIDNSATDMLDEGEVVMDSFLIRIRDTAGAVSNTIPIGIMITGTNDRPVITTTDSTTGTRMISDTDRDSINTFASLTGMAQAQDPDADDSAFTWGQTLQDISLAHFGTLSFDPGNTGMWTFDPDAAAINALSQGDQSVLIYDITATDAQGAISQAMPLMITITGINDAPTQVISDGLSVTEGGEREITTALLQFNDVDNDAEDLTYTITDAPDYGTLQKLVEGTWGDLGTDTFTQADIDAGCVRYQHGGSENLADSFEYSVSDGANTVTGSFDVTISQGNDAPTATETTSPAPDKEARESGHNDDGSDDAGDTIASGAFTHSDPDMAQPGFVAGTPEAARAGTTDYMSTPVRGMYGMLALTSGTWRYEIDNSATDMLDEGEVVMDRFLIRIRDTAGAFSNIIPIDITITGTNDAPTDITTTSDLLVANYNDIGQSVLPSTGLFIATLGTIDVDIGDTHTYSITDVDGNTHASSFQLRATNGQNLGPGQTATTVSNIASENVHLWLVGNPPTSRRISENWNIAITTTDSNGGTYSEEFRIMRGGGLAVTGVDGTQAFTNGPGLLRENFDPQVAGNAELSYPTDPVTTTASQSWDVRVLDPASPEMPPTADMAVVGPNNELTITAVRAGMSSTAPDTPPVIRVSVTIADDAAVAINPDMMTGGTVVIDVTAPTGTTWAQIANLIRTGNIEGTMSPANPSPVADYITATATATTPAMSVSLTTLQGGLGALAIPEDALTPSTAMIGANGELRITSDIEGASSAIGVPEVSVLLRTGAQENVEVEVSETGEITIILTAILSTTTWTRLEEMINLGLDGSGNGAPAAAHVTAQVVIPEGRPSPGGETIDGEDALPEGVVPPKADSLTINGLTITSRFEGDNSEVGVPEIRVTVRDTNDQNRPSNIVVDDSDPERVHIIITKTAVDDDFFGSWGGIELVINSGYDENGDTGQRNDVLKYISARFDRFNNENQLLEDTGGITERVLSGGVGVPASVTAPGLGLRLTLKESGETIDGSEDLDRPLITLRIDKKQGAPGSEPSARLVGITDSSRGTHITVRIEITETEDKPFTQWDIIRDYINNDVDYGLSSYVYVTLADVPDGVFPGSISVTGGRDVRGVVLSTPVEPKADSFTINGITFTSRFEGDNSLEGVPEIRVTVNVSNDQDNPSTIVVDDSDPEHVHIIITKTEEDSFTTWGAIQLYITSGLDENGRYNQGNDVRKYISARVTGERPLLEDTGGITERVLSGGVGVPASVTAPGLGLRLTLKDAGETIDGSAEFDRPLITLRIDKKQGAPGSDPSARLVDVVDHYPANSATVVVEITETEDKPFTQWDIIRDFINDEKDVFGLPGFVHAALTDVPDGVFPGSISVTGGRDLTHETIIPVTPEMLEGGEGVPLIIGTPDTLTVADGTSTDQLRFIAARIGDGDASTTDSAPHITVALTTGGTQIGFRIDATTTEGTTAITIEAPAGTSWGDIASAINTDTSLQVITRAEAVGTSGNPAEAFTAKELTGGAYGQDPVIAVPAIPAVNVPQAEEMIDDVEQVAVGLLVGTLSDGVGSTRFEVLYNEDDEDEDEADERVFVVADDDQLYYIGDLTGDADADTYEITVRAYDGPASGDFTQEYEYVVNLDML